MVTRLFRLSILAAASLSVALSEAAEVRRVLPERAVAGIEFEVRFEVEPGAGTRVFAIEDSVPVGWQVGAISEQGSFDLAHRKVKWGPFFSREPRSLSYRVTPEFDRTGAGVFEGVGQFDAQTTPITGAGSVIVLPFDQAFELICVLPQAFLPNVTLWITNRIRPALTTQTYAVEEAIPSGWKVESINFGGAFDAVSRRVKWGPFFDHRERNLIYGLVTEDEHLAVLQLAGQGAFDGLNIPIAGERRSVRAVSWAERRLTRTGAGNGWAVEIVLHLTGPVRAYAVQDAPPAGATVQSMNEDGVFDPVGGRVKWGPFLDGIDRILRYELALPEAASGEFHGSAAFDGVVVNLVGDAHPAEESGSVKRELAENFLPGLPVPVTLSVKPGAAVTAYAVEEMLPAGWVLLSASEGGQWDPIRRKVKWGPFYDHTTRELRYEARSGAGASGACAFEGIASFDGVTFSIGGAAQIEAISVAQANQAVRALPLEARSGKWMQIVCRVTTAPNVVAWALEDRIPEGGMVQAISEGGIFDPVQGAVKWGPFVEIGVKEFSYELQIAADRSVEVRWAGRLSVDGLSLPVAGPSRLGVHPNGPPVGRMDIFERGFAEDLQIHVSNLLINDSDPEGDPLEVAAVGEWSSGGGQLVAEGSVFRYIPPDPAPEVDRFAYRVRDVYGAESSSWIEIHTRARDPFRNLLQIETVEGGLHVIRFAGLPNRPYAIEATSELRSGLWSVIGIVTADRLGLLEFKDAEAPSYPQRYYRTRSQ